MVVPLVIRGDIRGLFSIEFSSSGRLKRSVLDLLTRLARPLACLLWDSDVHSYNQERTSHAVSQFLNSVGNFSFDSAILEGDERAGFIARPFADEFAELEKRLFSLLEAREVRARAYHPEGGQPVHRRRHPASDSALSFLRSRSHWPQCKRGS